MQNAILNSNPAFHPRARVENLVRNAYANRKVKEVMRSNVPSSVAQRDPHALAVGGFRQRRGGGVGCQRSGPRGSAGNGAGKQQQQWGHESDQLQQQQ